MLAVRINAILIAVVLAWASTAVASLAPKDADPRRGICDVAIDANGNQVSKVGGDTYTWDFDDRLVRVEKADGTVVDNVYDVDGVLVQTTVTPASGPPTVTDLVVDTAGGLSHVLAEVTAGTVDVVYVRAGNMLLSELRGGDVRYFEAEGIGSVRSLMDGTGAQTDTWRYTAFGEEVARTGSGANPYRFAGERFVGNVGLYQNRARWLDVGRGAFVSVDPFRGAAMQPLSMVPYLYVQANPANFTDPTGEFTTMQAIGVVAIMGATANIAFTRPRNLTESFKAAAIGATFAAGAYGTFALTELITLRIAQTLAAGASAAPVLKGPISDAQPLNLAEQIVLEGVKAGGVGGRIMEKVPLADAPRLAANYGAGTWAKFEYVYRNAFIPGAGKDDKTYNIVVHWFVNLATGKTVEFKFKR